MTCTQLTFSTLLCVPKTILTYQSSNGLERALPSSRVCNALTSVPINIVCIYYSQTFRSLSNKYTQQMFYHFVKSHPSSSLSSPVIVMGLICQAFYILDIQIPIEASVHPLTHLFTVLFGKQFQIVDIINSENPKILRDAHCLSCVSINEKKIRGYENGQELGKQT